MDDALSVIPTVFTWPKKNFITSYNGMPLKPGKKMALLFLTTYVAGADEVILFIILLITGVSALLFLLNPFFGLIPSGILLHISYDH